MAKLRKGESEWMREGRAHAEMLARVKMDRAQIEVRIALKNTPITLLNESPRIPIDWSNDNG